MKYWKHCGDILAINWVFRFHVYLKIMSRRASQYGVDDALIKDFLDALNNCEFARFAPGDDNQAMDKVYSDSLEVISKMENSIKH